MKFPVILTMVAVALLQPGVFAREFGMVGHPLTHEVDTDGKLKLSFEVATLSTPSGELPVRMTYGSADPLKSGILPKGWCIPFLDSSIFQISESVGQFLHPNGETMLFEISGDGETIRGGHGLTGTINDKVIKIESPEYKIEFANGKIRRFVSGDLDIKWLYDGKTLTKVMTDTDALAVQVTGESAFKTLQLKGKTADATVSLTKPEFSNEVLEKMGMDHVSEVKGRSGAWLFEKSGDPDSDLIKMTVTNQESRASNHYQWSRSSGVVSLVDDRLYEVKHFTTKTMVPQIRTFSAEKGWHIIQQGYDYDDGKMVETHYLENGDKEHVHYIFTKAGRQARKKVLEKPDGTQQETYRAQFGQDGNLLRDKVGDYERRSVDGRIQVWKGGKLQYEY